MNKCIIYPPPGKNKDGGGIFMSKNNKDNNFWFKIDKDKIKVQLKDIGSKFVDTRSRKRKITTIITICIIVGLGIALYINYNQEATVVPDMNADIQLEPADTVPEYESVEGEEVEFVANPETGVRLELEQEELTLGDESPEKEASESKANNSSVIDNDNRNSRTEQKSQTNQTEHESEVTAPIKPIDRVTGEDSLNPLKPVSGQVIQQSGWFFHPVFQDWRYQSGIKLEGQAGDIVMAAMDGKVISISEDQYLGITVTLQHENNWQTVYGHLAKTSVSEGASVAKGQEVGRVGDSGLLEEPALYFELNHNGEAVKASKYFD